MPHPIYGPPDHALEVVRVVLRLPTRRNGHTTLLEAHGESSTKRGPLWSVRETWAADEVQRGLQPVDAVQHLLLVASQDRPASQDPLERALLGQAWEEVPLF